VTRENTYAALSDAPDRQTAEHCDELHKLRVYARVFSLISLAAWFAPAFPVIPSRADFLFSTKPQRHLSSMEYTQ
jgi:hypothetical protein